MVIPNGEFDIGVSNSTICAREDLIDDWNSPSNILFHSHFVMFLRQQNKSSCVGNSAHIVSSR